MGGWDLFPPPSSSFRSVVRQKRGLQPLPAAATLFWGCGWGWGAGGERWRAEGLGKPVVEPRMETSVLPWEVPAPGGRALEVLSLDLGAKGLGSSSGSAAKPWPSFLTALGFSFPVSKTGCS